jgi:DNA-binding transcriptional regulator GbsR (MarR family)
MGVPDGGAKEETLNELSEIERQVISFCCDGVRLMGMPKSIGEIYGLLYVSRDPLSLDDLVEKLGISKGSASQGLKMLRTLGAILEVEGEDSRRTYFKADLRLKQLVGGFIREQVRPHLQSGEAKLQALAEEAGREEDPEAREFYQERVEKLDWWSKKARLVLPLLQKVLGE